MHEMGISAVYPGPHLSQRHPDHRVYPYLLRNVTASYPNHVWGVDITYVRLRGGWLYLVAVLDWFSRYVVSWTLDDTLEIGFVLAAVEQAKYLAPYIFRSALSNNRLEQVANERVTFRYTEGKTGAHKRATLPVDTFIGRFLAHVLPKGFVKVRYYGLLAVGKRQMLTEARSVMALVQAVPPPPRAAAAPGPLVAVPPDVRRCPSCGQPMQLIQTLQPQPQHHQVVTNVPEPSSRGSPHPQWERVHL
jgi:hypothetical protein